MSNLKCAFVKATQASCLALNRFDIPFTFPSMLSEQYMEWASDTQDCCEICSCHKFVARFCVCICSCLWYKDLKPYSEKLPLEAKLLFYFLFWMWLNRKHELTMAVFCTLLHSQIMECVWGNVSKPVTQKQWCGGMVPQHQVPCECVLWKCVEDSWQSPREADLERCHIFAMCCWRFTTRREATLCRLCNIFQNLALAYNNEKILKYLYGVVHNLLHTFWV